MRHTKITGANFFKAGGTLHPDAPSYVERPADKELFRQVVSGQFCYVLTPRQMGKSSLMIRTAEQLRREGTKTAVVDLSGIGAQQVTKEQWYLGILKQLTQELNQSIKPESWWSEHRTLGPLQRFTDFLHDVVLAEVEGQMVIFIDEIDSTLKLDFTDDFFAAIRAMYNLRAAAPEYNRLTFVLLGMSSPSDLIQDRNRTPFNIGQAIDLQEFSRRDAWPLQNGLEQIYAGQGQSILDRIFFWTNGHPYLTQKLCLEIAESSDNDWPRERIDNLVEKLFFDKDASKEDNLQSVHESVKADQQRRQLLWLYRRVYKGEVVKEDRRSLLQNRLNLIGLVRNESGVLHIRNEIYRRAFNLPWIKENTPTNWSNWSQIVTFVGGTISVLALVLAFLFIRIVIPTRTYSDNFRQSSSANAKVYYLAELCSMKPVNRCQVAQSLFFAQDQEQQLAMFRQVNAQGAGEKLVVVVECLYPSISDSAEEIERADDLSKAMGCALHRLDPEQGHQFSKDKGLELKCETQAGENHE